MKIKVFIKKEIVLQDEVDNDYRIVEVDDIQHYEISFGVLILVSDGKLKAAFKEWSYLKVAEDEKNGSKS